MNLDMVDVAMDTICIEKSRECQMSKSKCQMEDTLRAVFD
jgi:hypothetical protein